ncbi:PP2C family serine/threonine-protein phosphatase [Engelhardtia mirabilis]|uniref:PPM-type phosphatase domain-containing protein n=1 Tax=Engelhardtia mirabilis TaxID=2528011 RepID=A0A518BSV2_9BACT|nr:hypothetical protein Pla133_51790 [Planctomycetes bacterium Pla133]QDV04381.1 hypothetical protein Pla86_51760 [Planctomycetes bacterium Pla86]
MTRIDNIDVHGLSIAGSGPGGDSDSFAIADLAKSLHVHQTNLDTEDGDRVHGANQGHLFLIADGTAQIPSTSGASDEAARTIVDYFLGEMPWHHLAGGRPDDVATALVDAVENARQEVARSAPGASGARCAPTLAFVNWPDLYVAHLGGGQCYLQREEEPLALLPEGDEHERSWGDGLGSALHLVDGFWNAVRGNRAARATRVRHFLLRAGDQLVLLSDGAARDRNAPEVGRILRDGGTAEQLCGRLIGASTELDQTVIVARFLAEAKSADPVVAHPRESRLSTAAAQALRELTRGVAQPSPARTG